MNRRRPEGGAMQDLMIRAYVALEELKERVRQPLANQTGQTAAEYLGIVVVVAFIIGALATSEIGDKIRQRIVEMIDTIFGGGK
jgi:Flp pilus assembly pilin Flp